MAQETTEPREPSHADRIGDLEARLATLRDEHYRLTKLVDDLCRRVGYQIPKDLTP